MGIYAEYLNGGLGASNFGALEQERKKQLSRIAGLRKRDVLVYAVDINKGRLPIGINYSDLLPLQDQIANLKGNALDLILETPGGAGETAEDIVKMLRGKYESVAVIVPGMAKSAGTLIAMAGDELLMSKTSSLGPIDAQINWQGKTFSAHAFLEGLKKIKEEAVHGLNRAYIPILQNVSPGEIQHFENALEFAKELVTDWLVKYKFKNWTVHTSTGQAVTAEERRQRANEIAAQLADHGRWKTHGRSLKLEDLRQMKLLVTDYSEDKELADAITRYHTLLQMSFESNLYKIFETPTSQVLRLEAPQESNKPTPVMPQTPKHVEAEVLCKKCGKVFKVQGRLEPDAELKPGIPELPADNKIKCPNMKCGAEINLTQMRQKIEGQLGRVILAPKKGDKK